MSQKKTRIKKAKLSRKKLWLVVPASFVLFLAFAGYKTTYNKQSSASIAPLNNLVFDSNRTGNYEIFKINTSGTVTQLTSDKNYDSWWPKPSPDGKKIVFTRTPKSIHDTDYTKTSLWSMNTNGTSIQQLIPNKGYAWVYQGHPEWAPNGSNLVMIGGLGHLYITSPTGTNPVKINVSGQIGGLSDPAWAPNGQSILYAYQRHVWRVSKNGGAPTQLTNDAFQDYDPYYSPSGSQIAILTHTSSNLTSDWSIRVMNANGSNLHFLINDGNINSKPEWSPSGSSIYFHRHPTGAGSGFFGLWMMSGNGSNLAAINAGSGSNEYPEILPAIATSTSQTSGGTSSGAGSTKTSNSSSKTPSNSKTSPSNPNSTMGTNTQNKTNAVNGTSKTDRSNKKNPLVGLLLIGSLVILGWLGFRRYRQSSPQWLKK